MSSADGPTSQPYRKVRIRPHKLRTTSARISDDHGLQRLASCRSQLADSGAGGKDEGSVAWPRSPFKKERWRAKTSSVVGCRSLGSFLIELRKRRASQRLQGKRKSRRTFLHLICKFSAFASELSPPSPSLRISRFLPNCSKIIENVKNEADVSFDDVLILRGIRQQA